ncbi:hypothetical protein Droror1_Dr00017656 [Drosera rotundifolia]
MKLRLMAAWISASRRTVAKELVGVWFATGLGFWSQFEWCCACVLLLRSFGDPWSRSETHRRAFGLVCQDLELEWSWGWRSQIEVEKIVLFRWTAD